MYRISKDSAQQVIKNTIRIALRLVLDIKIYINRKMIMLYRYDFNNSRYIKKIISWKFSLLSLVNINNIRVL